MSEKVVRLFLQPLRLYAACGFIVSLAMHLLALAGLQPSSNVLLIGLGVAIFPLWLPVVQFSMKLASGLDRKEAWKALTSGGPKWMEHTTNALYWYALVNFAAVIVITFLVPTAASNSESAPRIFWVFASSYYMLFYFAGLAILTTVNGRGMPTCPNNHPTSPNDKYCRICGAPILLANGRGAA